MIAQDTGYWPIQEEHFGADSLNRFHRLLQKSSDRMVLQSPCLFMYMEHLATVFPGLLVVMMRRNEEDILASQARIGWSWEQPELMRCLTLDSNQANVKYSIWDSYMKQNLGRQAMELEYESLKQHPLWVDKEDREEFSAWQTQ